MNIKDEIYDIVIKIPKGKVITYGDIALRLGNINLSRVVGNVLHQNPNPNLIPCYKVINSQGKLSNNFAFGGINEQKNQLEKENIIVKDNKVDLEKYRWQIKEDELC